MSRKTSAVLLWLFVINLGIATGAGLYEHRIVVPRWIESGAHWNADAAIQDDTGRNFWGMVTTVPLTLLTLVSLFAAWRSSGTLRTFWLTAGIAALADRVFTFSYFIPTMVRLMKATDTPESVAMATQWSNVNNVRLVILFVAWLAALKAFAVVHQQRSGG